MKLRKIQLSLSLDAKGHCHSEMSNALALFLPFGLLVSIFRSSTFLGYKFWNSQRSPRVAFSDFTKIPSLSKPTVVLCFAFCARDYRILIKMGVEPPTHRTQKVTSGRPVLDIRDFWRDTAKTWPRISNDIKTKQNDPERRVKMDLESSYSS